MKAKIVALSLCIGLILFSFSSCENFDIRDYIPGNWDPYYGERPVDYPSAKWVSTDPDIWFEVEEDSHVGERVYGRLTLEDTPVDISVRFNRQSRRVQIYVTSPDFDTGYDGKQILVGTCDFGPDKMVMYVHEEDEETEWLEDYFEGKYKKITFIREDIPKTSDNSSS